MYWLENRSFILESSSWKNFLESSSWAGGANDFVVGGNFLAFLISEKARMPTKATRPILME